MIHPVAILSGTIQANPIDILGAKCKFWFKNPNSDNITFNGGNVASQIDETANFILKQATPSAQPAWNAGIISFDGIAEGMYLRTAADGPPLSILSDTEGFFFVVWEAGDPGDTAYFFSAADEATANNQLQGGYRGTDQATISDREGGVTNTVDFDTDASRIWQFRTFSSDGSRYQSYKDGVLKAVTAGSDGGDWLGDNSALDNITVGMRVRNTTMFYKYSYKHFGYASPELSASELSALATWAAAEL